MQRLSRRDFLRLMGGGALAIITGCTARPQPSPTSRKPDPTPTPEPTALPPEKLAIRPAPDIPPPPMKFTSLDEFYIQSYGGTPRVDPAQWRLRVDGLVEQPLTLTLDEVRALPSREFVWTLECISNPPGGNLIGNQVWRGTPLVPLLEKAGIRPEATRVLWHAADGYTTSLPLERVLHPDAMLVYEMGGQPLPREHGFPLRVFIPGHYGQKMPKWLERIELVDRAVLGYWERRGWDDMAIIKPNSRIDMPRTGVEMKVGEVLDIEGVAMADEHGVAQVAVGIEDPNGQMIWVDTVRTYGDNPYTWVVWRTQWTPERPGRYQVFARAWDKDGRTQRRGRGGLLAGTFPSGSDYMHAIVVRVSEA